MERHTVDAFYKESAVRGRWRPRGASWRARARRFGSRRKPSRHHAVGQIEPVSTRSLRARSASFSKVDGDGGEQLVEAGNGYRCRHWRYCSVWRAFQRASSIAPGQDPSTSWERRFQRRQGMQWDGHLRSPVGKLNSWIGRSHDFHPIYRGNSSRSMTWLKTSRRARVVLALVPSLGERVRRADLLRKVLAPARLSVLRSAAWRPSSSRRFE